MAFVCLAYAGCGLRAPKVVELPWDTLEKSTQQQSEQATSKQAMSMKGRAAPAKELRALALLSVAFNPAAAWQLRCALGLHPADRGSGRQASQRLQASRPCPRSEQAVQVAVDNTPTEDGVDSQDPARLRRRERRSEKKRLYLERQAQENGWTEVPSWNKRRREKREKRSRWDFSKINQISPDVLLPLWPSSELPTVEDLLVVQERQLKISVDNIYAVEGARCKYGMPRAYVQYPVDKQMKTCSGMIRLSCPHLVKEIDEWESEGAIEYINGLLEKDDGPLKSNFNQTNMEHAKIRSLAVSEEEKEMMVDKVGSAGAQHLMGSGIIGVSQGKVDDIKCVHAHVADFLLRGQNLVGEMSLEYLKKERGVDVRGCEGCSQQCSLNVSPKDAEWWYMPAKNKQRLRLRPDRRAELREARRQKAEKKHHSESETPDAAPQEA